MRTDGRTDFLRLAVAAVVVAAAAATAAPSWAQDAVLELDPAGSRVEFTVGGFPHSAHGTFALKRGTIRFDPATGKADGLVIVDAASGDSGNRSRDADMKEDVLEAQRFPEIRFAPQRVEGHAPPQGESRVKVRGVMSLHGGEHEITMNMVVRVVGGEFTATGDLIVPYVAWGLRDPSVFIFRVSDKVELKLTATGHVTWPPASGAREGRASGGKRSEEGYGRAEDGGRE